MAHELFSAMQDWDGTSAAALAAVYVEHSGRCDFQTNLISACQNPATERAATWLVKHHCETGQSSFSPEACTRLYMTLPAFEAWDAQLHVLQVMDFLPVPKEAAQVVFDVARDGANSAQKLICAWSLYGVAKLAAEHPEYRAAAKAILEEAAQLAPKGAIAVRLRKAQALLP